MRTNQWRQMHPCAPEEEQNLNNILLHLCNLKQLQNFSKFVCRHDFCLLINPNNFPIQTGLRLVYRPHHCNVQQCCTGLDFLFNSYTTNYSKLEASNVFTLHDINKNLLSVH